MVSRENSEELPPFWEQRSDLYYNTITNFSEKDRPENVHGGILADDMGLVIIFFIKLIAFYFLTKIFFNFINLTSLGLYCYTPAFSCGEQGLLSHEVSFSCSGAPAPELTGLSNCSAQAK